VKVIHGMKLGEGGETSTCKMHHYTKLSQAGTQRIRRFKTGKSESLTKDSQIQ